MKSTGALSFLVWSCVCVSMAHDTFAPAVQAHLEVLNTPKEKDSCAELFTQWVAKFQRVYESDVEHANRLSIFCDNLKFAAQFNANSSSHQVGLNKMADLTVDEYRAQWLSGGAMLETTPPPELLTAVEPEFRGAGAEPPASVDWRVEAKLNKPKNQRQCGGCWAFAAVGAIEALHYITHGELVSLSEQELISCSSPPNQGCIGGRADFAFEWVVKNKGLNTEQAYPYTSASGVCDRRLAATRVASIDAFTRVPPQSERALMAAVAQAPVAVAIEADQQAFQLYTGGVFQSACGHTRDHAVLVVGYGEDVFGGPYWIVRNSWGDSWGEHGYIRMARGVDAPYGKCGMLLEPVAPVLHAPRPPPHHAAPPPPTPHRTCDQYTICPLSDSCCCDIQLGDYCASYKCCAAGKQEL